MNEQECLKKRDSHFFLSKSIGKGMNGVVYEVYAKIKILKKIATLF